MEVKITHSSVPGLEVTANFVNKPSDLTWIQYTEHVNRLINFAFQKAKEEQIRDRFQYVLDSLDLSNIPYVIKFNANVYQ